MSVATIASLRAAAEAQKASAERALRNLDEIEARGDTDDDASEELESLASTMAKELGGVVESWRGAAEGNKPREMVGVGLMMGGLSLGELKGAIASRPSKNTDDDDDDDDDDGADDANRKIGVRVVNPRGCWSWRRRSGPRRRRSDTSGDTCGVRRDDATTVSRRGVTVARGFRV